MLNKELLMGNTGGQQPVALTVGKRQLTSPPRVNELCRRSSLGGSRC